MLHLRHRVNRAVHLHLRACLGIGGPYAFVEALPGGEYLELAVDDLEPGEKGSALELRRVKARSKVQRQARSAVFRRRIWQNSNCRRRLDADLLEGIL